MLQLSYYGDQQEYNIRSLPISGVQIYRGSGVPDGSSKIIKSSPRKSGNHDRHCNTGIRCNSIRSGVTISGQVNQYQVLNISVSGKLNTEPQ